MNDFLQIFLNFEYPILSLTSFILGLGGICVLRRNLIVVFMSLELMLFGVNLLLIYFSALYDDLTAQIFAFIILTTAAAESSIGLAILVIYYRLHGQILLDATQTKG